MQRPAGIRVTFRERRGIEEMREMLVLQSVNHLVSQRNLLAEVSERRRTERTRLPPATENRQSQTVYIAYAVPLVARETYLGCLYLDGPEDALIFDSSDLIFLSALANQVAVALDRAELASRWKHEKERLPE